MTRTRFAALGALGLAAALALAGCSAGSNGASDSGTKSIGTPDGKGKTITVWMMNGDLSEKVLDAAETAVHQGHRGEGEGADPAVGRHQHEAQHGPGAVERRRTSSTSATPRCRCYAATGGLKDLTPYAPRAQGGQDLALRASTGRPPSTASSTAHRFRRQPGGRLQQEGLGRRGRHRGSDQYEELTADLDKVKAANTAQRLLARSTCPAQYWYGGLQWVWDAGGEIATEKGGKWTGTLDSAEARQGARRLEAVPERVLGRPTQDINTTSRRRPTSSRRATPSAFLGSAWEIGSITTAKPTLADQIGTFPLPSMSGRDAAGVPRRLGPRHPRRSRANPDLALHVHEDRRTSKSSSRTRSSVSTDGSRSPRSCSRPSPVTSTTLRKPYFEAATTSRPTPATPGWATIEGDASFQSMFARRRHRPEVAGGSRRRTSRSTSPRRSTRARSR